MGLDINDLKNQHLDVLKEVGNIGSGNAATALAKMLNKKVDMGVPSAKVMEFKEVSDILGGAEVEVVGIILEVEGDLKGEIMFMLRLDAAAMLVSILMNQDISKLDEFDEIHISALKEVGNILTGAYLSALSLLTKMTIVPSVPSLSIDMAGAILSVPAIEFGKVGDTVLYIETEFIDGLNKVVGDFFLIPDMDSYEKLLKALGVIS
ncbi:MAG: chemotaxis protein CheC [Clostridiales bacterium]